MLKVKKINPDAKLPTVATPGEDLAYDLYAIEDVVLPYGIPVLVKTGISAQAYQETPEAISWRRDGHSPVSRQTIPCGLLIRDRSSMALKGITTSAGVIDAGYTGELAVLMTNWVGRHKFYAPYTIKKGDKIAQMIPIPVLTGDIIEVEELRETVRGSDGFGSSGK